MERQHIACSDENRSLLEPVIIRLNDIGPFEFVAHYYPDEAVIRNAVGRDFGILFPKSSLSLNRILDELTEKTQGKYGQAFHGEATIGFSPVVFFLSPRFAERVGIVNEPLAWRRLSRLHREGDFSIRHASARQTDGEAVALAQHLAFQSDASSPDQQMSSAVRSVERQVDEYGPDDREVLRRAVGDGNWKADLVVAQERSVISAWPEDSRLSGVIAYPQDGTLAIPVTLALADYWQKPDTEQAFKTLVDGFARVEPNELAKAGLHKNTESLRSPEAVAEFASQTNSAPGIRWAPHSGVRTLTLPSRRAAKGISALAGTTQRSVDVCLIFDSSSSMDDLGKFREAISGIDSFLMLLSSTNSRVCLIRIRTQATVVVPLWPRPSFRYERSWLEPNGKTALIDAVSLATDILVQDGAESNIRAIVGFTDGQENSSSRSVSDVLQALKANPRVRFYGVAYGSDADTAILQQLADATDGLAVTSDTGQIKALYERLSTYF